MILKKKVSDYQKTIAKTVHGKRPIIIVPIDSHCNLPQNKTLSYPPSQLIVDPDTFSRREIALGRVQVQQKKKKKKKKKKKIGGSPASKDGTFRCLGTPQNRSTMKK